MKTIAKTLKTFRDVSIGILIGILSIIAPAFVCYVAVTTSNDTRGPIFEMYDKVFGKQEDKHNYTEIR